MKRGLAVFAVLAIVIVSLSAIVSAEIALGGSGALGQLKGAAIAGGLDCAATGTCKSVINPSDNNAGGVEIGTGIKLDDNGNLPTVELLRCTNGETSVLANGASTDVERICSPPGFSKFIVKGDLKDSPSSIGLASGGRVIVTTGKLPLGIDVTFRRVGDTKDTKVHVPAYKHLEVLAEGKFTPDQAGDPIKKDSNTLWARIQEFFFKPKVDTTKKQLASPGPDAKDPSPTQVQYVFNFPFFNLFKKA